MPQIKLHLPSAPAIGSPTSPLPSLLHTPRGLAILEIQGRLNIANEESGVVEENDASATVSATEIGRIEFPFLSPFSASKTSSSEDGTRTGDKEGPWSKKVHLYIGKNQRLVGEVKQLAKPLAIVRRKIDAPEQGAVALHPPEDMDTEGERITDKMTDDLEIVDIVKWKLFFGGRPEFV